ncbi:PTS sugar transporter subunit IIC [Clostridium paraputrificum]|uniref:PTS sugar transporter subunit IIC n=1 Tax=Clostridium paraputrificum TaxID=29363 RepID=UPI00232FFF45|nr:PTS transporter subunit EIIC [Clostridium paraputrificum]MDB2107204.1 PTS transporter subunit EIIC [Clostridium paraputrificum]MDB2113761.1 PTS transporter subunit EIIC [Clostridium paraputrificum]
MKISEFFNDKFVPGVMKLINTKPFLALKGGMLYTMPLTILGSFFLIIANFPVKAVTDIFVKVFGENWAAPLNQVTGSTMDIIAIVAVIGIAYEYVENNGYKPLPAAVISFTSFLVVINSFVVSEAGEKIGGVIPKRWTGGQGVVCAIIVGLVVGAAYSWFMEKKFTIKMPAGVPQGVANAFLSLVPGIVILTGAMLVHIASSALGDKSFSEIIYAVIQTPLQGATDSLGGVILICFFVPFFWLFGVHGSVVVGGVVDSLLKSNTLANQAILDAGKELTIANGAHIVTQQFTDQFVHMTGAGVTLGLVLSMLIVAKSQQYKTMGKMSVVPGIFNINEPVIFGTPIVLNPMLAIPFIAVPMITGLSLYFSIALGILPPFSGVMVPWIIPPVISGLLLGSWKYAVFQALLITVSTMVYLPFLKKQDTIAYNEEQGK